ncbi:MAG: ABC transporter ATP-binding protein [Bacillota bacterium]
MHQFALLKGFFVEHRRQYALGIMFLVLTDLLQLILPRILGNFADDFQQKSLTGTAIWKYSLLVILVSLALALCRYFWRLHVQGASRKLEFYLRQRFLGHLIQLPPSFFDRQKTGELMALATNDISAVRMCFGIGVVMLTDTLVLTLVALYLMFFTVHMSLTLLALIPLPLMALAATRFSSLIHRRFKEVQAAFADLTGNVQETLTGIRVVQTFAQEESRLAGFAKYNLASLEANLRLAKAAGLLFPLIQFLAALSFLAVLGYGGSLVVKGMISLGDFVAFNGYLAALTWPMMALGWLINLIQRGIASMERLNRIFSLEPAPAAKGPFLGTPKAKGDIRVQNLSFTYPGSSRPALRHLHFQIGQGQTLALVGRTGAGKSTLLQLLLRIYEPPEKTIFLDERDILTWPREILRQNIGYVPQDPFLFSTSIKDNIAYGSEVCDLEKVRAAARAAQLEEEIMDFPGGFDALVGERGVTLSGGQKQRLAIARALYPDPQLLLLDDCLAAVDAATERAILRNLQKLRRHRTTIIASHRLSSVQDADWIIVLEEGQICEEGTHHQLLARQGSYYQLYQKQLLEEELE